MDNQLTTIVAESGLESSKAQVILTQFQGYFAIADEWEKKAKMIVVTDGSQKAEMQMARTGRLFLKEKRVAIEKTRKELKEQALREGKAIDGIANVLKALIVPIEEHLDRQEHFVEIREKEAAEKARIEAEKKAEEERLAKEAAERAEQERIRIENEKLKAEAAERERQAALAQKKADEERAELERQIKEERDAHLAAERLARADQERLAAEAARAKKEAEAEAARLKAEADKAARKAAERLAAEVECPKCHHRFVPEK